MAAPIRLTLMSLLPVSICACNLRTAVLSMGRPYRSRLSASLLTRLPAAVGAFCRVAAGCARACSGSAATPGMRTIAAPKIDATVALEPRWKGPGRADDDMDRGAVADILLVALRCARLVTLSMKKAALLLNARRRANVVTAIFCCGMTPSQNQNWD